MQTHSFITVTWKIVICHGSMFLNSLFYIFSVTMLKQLPNGSAADGHTPSSGYESSDENEPLIRSGKGSIN